MLTWWPAQTFPLGTLTRNGLCTGHDVRGPQREGPGNGTELKLFVLLHGLHNGGGGCICGGVCNERSDGPCANIPPPPTCGPGHGCCMPPPMPASGGSGPDEPPPSKAWCGGPGPLWWHNGGSGGGPQWWCVGGGHARPWLCPPPQNGSTAPKFSWLPEHFKRCKLGGGDDCLEYILSGYVNSDGYRSRRRTCVSPFSSHFFEIFCLYLCGV